jgi:hypothetical protein
VTGGKLIAIWSQSISGVTDFNSLVAFHDIHGKKEEELFILFFPDTKRDTIKIKTRLIKGWSETVEKITDIMSFLYFFSDAYYGVYNKELLSMYHFSRDARNYHHKDIHRIQSKPQAYYISKHSNACYHELELFIDYVDFRLPFPSISKEKFKKNIM